MSAGVCAVCHGGAPAFTGAMGEAPEGRVVALHTHDVHGVDRHIVVCNECTRLLVAVWARMGKHRTARLRQKVQPTEDAVLECDACGLLILAGDRHGHVCVTQEEEDDGPQSE